MVAKVARKAAPKKAATTKRAAAPKQRAATAKTPVKPKAVTRKKVVTKKRKYTTGAAGGARAGSGRKTGAATKRTREIADKLAEESGITPLEYMLETLRTTPEAIKRRHKDGEIDDAEYLAEIKSLQDRRDWAAEKAAPYIHPRLASVEVDQKSPFRVIQELSDEQLDSMISSLLKELGGGRSG